VACRDFPLIEPYIDAFGDKKKPYFARDSLILAVMAQENAFSFHRHLILSIQ
jgi:hypothetical protein